MGHKLVRLEENCWLCQATRFALAEARVRDQNGAMPQPAGFSIRPATSDDVSTILSFIRALAEFENLTHEVTATEERLMDELFGASPRAEVLLACEHGKPVGFALYFHNFSTFLSRTGLYVEDIFILPEHRGKGYGRALMLQLAKIARKRGCGRFEWAVLDWNQRAIDFYRSLGAEPMSQWIIQRVTGEALERLAERPLFD
jgi:GNAT superfamily N-acetyltransferase